MNDCFCKVKEILYNFIQGSFFSSFIGQEKTQVWLPGASKTRTLVAQWASEISLSGAVSLSVSLVKWFLSDTNYFKTKCISKLRTARWVTQLHVAESMNQFKISVHVCLLVLLLQSWYWSNPVVTLNLAHYLKYS